MNRIAAEASTEVGLKDHADKSWLDAVPVHADTLRQLSSAFALMVGVAAIVAGLAVWGMYVGERDAQFKAQQAQEQAKAKAVARCERDRGEGARALVDQASGAVVCVGAQVKL